MNLNDAKKRIQAYLCSNKTWPLLVDVQTKSDKSEIIDYFKVGENTFPDIESFCNDDGDLKVDELYAAVSANVGNTFITNVTGLTLIIIRKCGPILRLTNGLMFFLEPSIIMQMDMSPICKNCQC